MPPTLQCNHYLMDEIGLSSAITPPFMSFSPLPFQKISNKFIANVGRDEKARSLILKISFAMDADDTRRQREGPSRR
ncbi:hypothetical protein Peur_001805 [Populus x canadensis]